VYARSGREVRALPESRITLGTENFLECQNETAKESVFSWLCY
jgi:hypothetical protein